VAAHLQSGIESGTGLGGHLRRPLAILEPVTGPLWELVAA
jgi:hypothetical protein